MRWNCAPPASWGSRSFGRTGNSSSGPPPEQNSAASIPVPLSAAGQRLRIGDRIGCAEYQLVFDVAREEALKEGASPSAATQITTPAQPGSTSVQSVAMGTPLVDPSRLSTDPRPLPRPAPAAGSPHAVRVSLRKELLGTFLLSQDKTYIGRMSENDIMIDDALVSRSHALIERTGADYQLRDQESENGVFLNGVKIGQGKLRPGDVIGIGDHELHFLIADAKLLAESEAELRRLNEQDEWRLSRTITVSEEEQRTLIEDLKHKEQLRQLEITHSSPPAEAGEAVKVVSAQVAGEAMGRPTLLHCRISLGPMVLEKEIPFDQVEESAAPQEDALEIQLNYQGKVFRRRIPLD